MTPFNTGETVYCNWRQFVMIELKPVSTLLS